MRSRRLAVGGWGVGGDRSGLALAVAGPERGLACERGVEAPAVELVLDRLVELVAPGGHLVVADVRSLPLLPRLAGFVGRDLAHVERNHHVLDRCQRRKEVVALEDEADALSAQVGETFR